MTVNLEKQDLINLLNGTEPSYDSFDKIPNKLFSYSGGFTERFTWIKPELNKLSETELFELYNKIKNI